eukprot:8894787-Alexandrium_andersonii.AAC.1
MEWLRLGVCGVAGSASCLSVPSQCSRARLCGAPMVHDGADITCRAISFGVDGFGDRDSETTTMELLCLSLVHI